MVVGVKKKAKSSPKEGTLLSQIKKMVQKTLEGKLLKQMHSLPQVDVPVISTQVGSGPPKKLEVPSAYFGALQQGSIVVLKDKDGTILPFGTPLSSDPKVVLKLWADDVQKQKAQRFSEMKSTAQAHFVETLLKASNEVYANTVHNGVWIDLSPGAFEAFKFVIGEKLKGSVQIEDVKNLKLTEIAGVPTLVGKGIVTKDETPDLTHVPSTEEFVKDAVKKGKLVGFKASDFIFQQPYIPVHTTPPITSNAEFGLVAWMDNTVKSVLNLLQFEPFDQTTLVHARDLIVKHFDDTVYSVGVGPPALFKTFGKEFVVYRTGLRLCHHLELVHGKFNGGHLKMFNGVFPPCTYPGGPPPFPLADMDPIVTTQGIADWMLKVAEIIFDFIHWQPITKELLIEVRKYIEEGYDEDFIPRVSPGFHGMVFNALEKLPKEGCVHRVIVRLRRLLVKKDGQFSDEVNALFAAVFPPPELPVIAAWAKFEPLVGTVGGPQAPTFVKTQEELEAEFGVPKDDNEQAKYVAILLKNTQEYLKAHPEAPGVGPLDGAGIVQTMIPFNVVNPNGHVYPKGIWDAAVKKLQPKFSQEAFEDAKAQGLGDKAEGIVLDSLSPDTIPEFDMKLVVDEEGDPYLETWCDGELIDKKLAPGALTSKGCATLNRFGAVLKETQ